MIDFENAKEAGFLPEFLSNEDPADAITQINAAYNHGGWRDFKGFVLATNGRHSGIRPDAKASLVYPGDPDMREVARGVLHPGAENEEQVVLFRGEWVAVYPTRDPGKFRVARIG
jgi:hypothetical protein